MKTLNLTLAMFAVTSQMIVNAQTTSNSIKNNTIEFSNQLQLLPVLGSKKQHQISKSISVKQVKFYEINVNSVTELEYQANEFEQIANELKAVSTTLTGIKKSQAINEMKSALIQSYVYQIKLSETLYVTRKTAFAENQLIIDQMLINKNNFQKALLEKITLLVNSANTDFKTAKEIRQEAYAMPTIGAISGALANAEEKENSAISKQLQTLNLIIESQPGNVNSVNLMVVN